MLRGRSRRLVAAVVGLLVAGSVVACGSGGDGGPPSCTERLKDARDKAANGAAQGTDLSGCDLSGQNFAEDNLYGWRLSGARLVNAVLTDAALESADLTGADLTGADLRGANLSGAVVRGATFTKTDLGNAKLSVLDLSALTFTEVSFADAKLDRASFAGSTLTGVDFTRAWLEEADFSGARLRRVDLTDARAARTTFTGTALAAVTLRNADLADAMGLTDDALVDALGVKPSQLAQTLADESVVLESSQDVLFAVQNACKGERIPDAVPGVTNPPRVVRGGADAVEWAAGDERSLPAARFIDVVVCKGKVVSTKVRTCGPYTGYTRYYDLYAETMTLRLVDPRQRATATLTVTSATPDECPSIMTNNTNRGHVNLLDTQSQWLPQADRFARQHPG